MQVFKILGSGVKYSLNIIYINLTTDKENGSNLGSFIVVLTLIPF